MKLITKWLPPNETFKSEYGQVSYEEWLKLERDRINENPERKTEIASDVKGCYCLIELNYPVKPNKIT